MCRARFFQGGGERAGARSASISRAKVPRCCRSRPSRKGRRAAGTVTVNHPSDVGRICEETLAENREKSGQPLRSVRRLSLHSSRPCVRVPLGSGQHGVLGLKIPRLLLPPIMPDAAHNWLLLSATLQHTVLPLVLPLGRAAATCKWFPAFPRLASCAPEDRMPTNTRDLRITVHAVPTCCPAGA